jgi:hypothetical protein
MCYDCLDYPVVAQVMGDPQICIYSSEDSRLMAAAKHAGIDSGVLSPC